MEPSATKKPIDLQALLALVVLLGIAGCTWHFMSAADPREQAIERAFADACDKGILARLQFPGSFRPDMFGSSTGRSDGRLIRTVRFSGDGMDRTAYCRLLANNTVDVSIQ